MDAFGYAVQAGAHVAGRQSLVFGSEVYDERIDAARNETDPVTGAVDQKRALYPNGSTYRTTSVFVQDAVDVIRGSDRGALKVNVGGRFTHVDVDTFADRNRNALGQSLGVVDSSQSYQDWTFNAGSDLAGHDATDPECARRAGVSSAQSERPGRARIERSRI